MKLRAHGCNRLYLRHSKSCACMPAAFLSGPSIFSSLKIIPRDFAAHAAAPPRPPGSPPLVPNLNISKITNVDSSMDLNQLDTRDVNEVSYVSRQRMRMSDFDPNATDDEGLPLVYNEDRIAEFWKQRPGELAERWKRFAGISLPWLSSLANSFIRGTIQRDQGRLAREAVVNLEHLGVLSSPA